MQRNQNINTTRPAATEERVVAHDLNDTSPTFVEHLARYDFAKTELKSGMRVLDAACGSGYGSHLLAQHGCHVIGGDLSAEAVTLSESNFRHERLAFRVLDVTRLDLPDRTFDAYVSFETIEHFANQGDYLSEAARILNSDGIFLASTPNKSVHDSYRAKGWMQPNPYHVKELYVEEFRHLLDKHFEDVSLYGEKLDPLWQLVLELRRQVSELRWEMNRLPRVLAKSLFGELGRSRKTADSKAHRSHPTTLDMIKISPTYLEQSDVVIAVCRRPKSG
jgi:SAM-dependent methyltransferase